MIGILVPLMGLLKKSGGIIFDNRGVGGSQGKTPATVQAMADDAIEFENAWFIFINYLPRRRLRRNISISSRLCGKGNSVFRIT